MKTIRENFTVEQVLSYAQNLCPKAQLVECEDVGSPYDPARFYDNKGRLVLGPVFTRSNEEYRLRSLLRQRRRGTRFCYLPNGQAGTGAILLAFWGEDTKLPALKI